MFVYIENIVVIRWRSWIAAAGAGGGGPGGPGGCEGPGSPSAGQPSVAAAEPQQTGAGRGRDADDKVHCLKRAL